MTRTLRDYQRTAVQATEQAHADGHLSQAGVAATGLGKSTILGQAVVDHVRRTPNARAFVYAHRNELVGQLCATIAELAPDIPVGVVAGQTHQPDFPITVAMTPTLAGARGARRRTHLEQWGRPTFVGYDEFHHAAAPGNMTLLKWSGAGGPGELDGGHPHYREPSVPMLGVTATLGRSDRYGLGDLVTADDIPFNLDISWGVQEGWLVAPRGRVVVAEKLDLSQVPTSKGDYQEKRLGEMIEQSAGGIVGDWCAHGEDRPTVGFMPTKDAAYAVDHEFVNHRCPRHPGGIASEAVTGETSATERGEAHAGTGIYGRLAQGRTKVMLGLMVPTEGWDCPPVSCVLMGRPTKLWTLYAQMVGRGLRPAAEASWGALAGLGDKRDCLVLDVVGTSRVQRLVSTPDLYPTAIYDRSALGSDEPDDGPAPEKRGPRRLEGPAIYEDVDLLLTDTGGAWLATHGGHPFLVSGKRVAVIFAEADGLTYRVATVNRQGRLEAELLGAGLGLGEAQRRAQAWAIGRKPHLGNASASWRTKAGRPDFRALRTASRLGIRDADVYSGRELSELIDITEMSPRLDPYGPGAAARSTA